MEAETPESRRAAHDLCRSLLQAERTLPYHEVRKSANGLGLTISKRMFAAVHRELAGTIRLVPREAPKTQAPIRTLAPERRSKEQPKKAPNPSMAFLVKHLTDQPDSSYGQAKQVAEEAGFRVYPVTYGLARKRAGLPKLSKPPTRRTATRSSITPSVPENAVQEVLARLRRLEDERDRLRKRIEAIKAVVGAVRDRYQGSETTAKIPQGNLPSNQQERRP